MNHIQATWKLIQDHPKLASFASLALLYGLLVIYLFLNGKFTDSNGKFDKSFWGIFHIIVWTVGPPIWFFFEYYVLNADATEPQLMKIKVGQEMAKNSWAAILAVILFLVPK